MILTNSLALAVQGLSLFLLVVVLYFQLFIYIPIALLAILMMSLVFWLNHVGRPVLASLLLMNFTWIGIAIASYVTYMTDLSAETENWLYATMAMVIFLFDGKNKIFHGVMVFSVICTLKYLKYDLLGMEMGQDFAILIINTTVLAFSLYFSLDIIRRGMSELLEELSESNESKNRLMSILAHDIRSPLSTFEALLSVGEAGIISKEDFLEHQQGLRKRFGVLQDTVNGVLDWSRLRTDSMDPKPVRFKPKEIVRKVVDVYLPVAEAKSIFLALDLEAIEIKSDPDHFRLIARNLINNALKFSPENGRVEIEVFGTASGCNLTVTDYGVGLLAEKAEAIKNYKLVESTYGTNGERGTGLGLNVSLELLVKNGGAIDIRSKVGRGSKFVVTLPSV